MNKIYLKSILLATSISIAGGIFGQASTTTTLASTYVNKIVYTSTNLTAESGYNSTSIKTGENTTNLNFRTKPSTSSSIIKVLPTNSLFIITNEYSEFYEIDYNGTVGYVAKQYVKIIDSEMIKNTSDIIGYTTNLTNSSKLNLRISPSVNSKILKQLPNNSAFKILFKHGDWYVINYDGTIGYVYDYYVHVLSNTSSSSINSKLVDFIALREGFSSTPYKDATGHWTVGFGENYGYTYPKSETYSEALMKLINNIESFRKDVKQLTVGLNLNQNQLNALTDFAFNLGIGSLKNSTILKNLRSGVTNPTTIKSNFQAWSYGGSKFLQGLYNRRTAEANMFLYGEY